MQTVDLGKSGVQTSRLAIGTGSNGWNYKSDQTALGLKGLADLFIYAHASGSGILPINTAAILT